MLLEKSLRAEEYYPLYIRSVRGKSDVLFLRYSCDYSNLTIKSSKLYKWDVQVALSLRELALKHVLHILHKNISIHPTDFGGVPHLVRIASFRDQVNCLFICVSELKAPGRSRVLQSSGVVNSIVVGHIPSVK